MNDKNAAAQHEQNMPAAGIARSAGAAVSTSDLLFASRAIEGGLTGDSATGDATLKFGILTGAAAMIETMPIEKAPETYGKMMAGKARLLMVLTMQS